MAPVFSRYVKTPAPATNTGQCICRVSVPPTFPVDGHPCRPLSSRPPVRLRYQQCRPIGPSCQVPCQNHPKPLTRRGSKGGYYGNRHQRKGGGYNPPDWASKRRVTPVTIPWWISRVEASKHSCARQGRRARAWQTRPRVLARALARGSLTPTLGVSHNLSSTRGGSSTKRLASGPNDNVTIGG
jgi:hypothetical protein